MNLPTTSASPALTKADFETDQEVRWCPGCGDYSVLAAIQKLLPNIGKKHEDIVFVSGIGCSSRFPYYVNSYGMHTIHGRAPSFATGIKITNPELSVWLVTGDGDALSIGGNHLLHLLRRNVKVVVLLFNNRVYGLTKGQYSPTSLPGMKTKSSPYGSADYPVNPIAFAFGAGATFVARTLDVDAKHMAEVFQAAHNHQGTAFIEIYQNCVIFNDDTFAYVANRKSRADHQVLLRPGKPLIFGEKQNLGIALIDCELKVVEIEPNDEQRAIERGVVVFDPANLTLGLLLSRLDHPEFPVPMGIFHQTNRMCFETALHEQAQSARAKRCPSESADENLRALFHSAETWSVTA